jgi:hypothetical protein
MASAKVALIQGIIGSLRLYAAWTLLASFYFGMELGKRIWKVSDDFYPFTILLWGALTVFWVLGVRSTLERLSFAVPLADADTVRVKTRGILLTDIIIACISTFFGLCLVASKRIWEMYPVGAAVFGTLLLLVGFWMYRQLSALPHS